MNVELLRWCGKSRAKRAAIRVVAGLDTRPIRAVSSSYRVNQCSLHRAIRELRAHLSSLEALESRTNG